MEFASCPHGFKAIPAMESDWYTKLRDRTVGTRAMLSVQEETERMRLVATYVRDVETAADVCACVFVLHPADADKPAGEPRRKRMVRENLGCAQHAREGFLLGFLAFLNGQSLVDYTKAERLKAGADDDGIAKRG